MRARTRLAWVAQKIPNVFSAVDKSPVHPCLRAAPLFLSSAVRATTNCTLWQFSTRQLHRLMEHQPDILLALCNSFLQVWIYLWRQSMRKYLLFFNSQKRVLRCVGKPCWPCATPGEGDVLFTTLYRNRRFVVYFSKRLCYSAFGHPAGPLALLSAGGWDVLVLCTEFLFLNLVVDVCYSVSKTLCNSTWTCSTLFSPLFFMEDACMLRMSRCRTTTPPHPHAVFRRAAGRGGATRQGPAAAAGAHPGPGAGRALQGE